MRKENKQKPKKGQKNEKKTKISKKKIKQKPASRLQNNHQNLCAKLFLCDDLTLNQRDVDLQDPKCIQPLTSQPKISAVKRTLYQQKVEKNKNNKK